MESKHLKALITFVKMGLAPALFFLVCFFVLTYPAMMRFRTHFFTGPGDGLQNVWNIWWVTKAISLHQTPWHTNYLHYPYGTSLIGHTLNPFNGFLAVVLSRFMSPVTVHNVIVTFSFVLAGVMTFLLAHYLTASYWPSMISGFVFTFSSFHFAHADGHLQLVSLQWIPLFVLLWLKLISKPTITRGAATGIVLFLVILCDYYYFFYCVLTALIILCWCLVREDGISKFTERRGLTALGAFSLISLVTSGILAGSVLLSNLKDPLVGAHPEVDFSLDLLAPFVYGGHWRFASLTRFYWTRLPGNISESCVYLGLSVVLLVFYVWRKRHLLEAREIGLLFFVLLSFFLLALGPTLHIAGKPILRHKLVLPYALLEVGFPFLKLSGAPVRMMVMVILASATISSFGFKLLFRGPTRNKALALLLLCLLFVEYLPKPISTLQVQIPKYVGVLRDLPGDDGVLDTLAERSDSLFYQTIDEKPLALGYLARLPKSVDTKDRQLADIIETERFDRLWPDYHLRYVVANSFNRLHNWPGTRMVWSDSQVGIFDVTDSAELFDPILSDSVEVRTDESTPCEGAIDSLNGASPKLVLQTISKTLSVDGWLAIARDAGIVPDAVFVTLSDEKGKKVYIKTRSTPRIDVKEHFAQPNMRDPGYVAHADVSGFGGRYVLGLSRLYKNKLESCREFSVPLFITD